MLSDQKVGISLGDETKKTDRKSCAQFVLKSLPNTGENEITTNRKTH